MDKDNKDKLAAIQELTDEDGCSSEVAELARELWAVANRCRLPDEAYLNLALCVAQRLVRYQTDVLRTGGEDIAGYTRPPERPLDILRRGVDDCDGKARLFGALAIAGGFSAEICPRYEGQSLVHVFARVRSGGKWLFVEPTAARSVLGETAQSVPKEKNGTWKT